MKIFHASVDSGFFADLIYTQGFLFEVIQHFKDCLIGSNLIISSSVKFLVFVLFPYQPDPLMHVTMEELQRKIENLKGVAIGKIPITASEGDGPSPTHSNIEVWQEMGDNKDVMFCKMIQMLHAKNFKFWQ